MELLIEREPTLLSYAGGKAFVGSDVPEFLKKPLCVHSALREQIRDNDSDLLLKDDGDCAWIEKHLCKHSKDLPVPALWSGRRSVLVQDPLSRKMYRIKGAAIDPYNPEPIIEKDNVRINGGQKLYNAICEARNSSCLNNILGDVGIEPVMIPIGIWKYPTLCRKLRPAASVFEVKGDTRLDELVIVLESLVSQRIKGRQYTCNWSMFFEDAVPLMFEVGVITGRLKGLMDRRGMVWGHDKGNTNAHWGNVVLYRDADKLRVNLVDLDMAGIKGDYTKQEMRKLQKEEYKDVITDMKTANAYSPREIHGKPFDYKGKGYFINCIRKPLRMGFDKGYSISSRKYSNELDIGRLLDMYYMLRLDMSFAVSKKEFNSEKYLTNLVDYWANKPQDFQVYVDKLQERKVVTPEKAIEMKVGMHIESLKRRGADTSELESKLERNPESMGEFLRGMNHPLFPILE